ncbi:MAG: DNA translocase FtsK [Nostoc sp. ChiQUE01a]|nr:DNA translocase FtsK [Nostoc sp. ChiQUE01a]
MLPPYNNTNGNTEIQKQQLWTAIVQAKQDGLSNEKIVENVQEALPDAMVFYAETVLKQIDFRAKLSRPVVEFNLEFLFQVIYESVIAGTNDDEILSICAEHCTLNQYEFVRYALEYIHLNRMPSQWEQNNVYQKMIEIVSNSQIEALFEHIESIKNIYLKQIGYEVVQHNLYNLFLNNKSITYFTDLANQSKDRFIKNYCYRTAVLVARAKGKAIDLKLVRDGTIVLNETKCLNSEIANNGIVSLNVLTMGQAGKLLVDTLEDFNINAKYVDAKNGPTFNRIRVKLGRGVSYKKVEDIGNDLVPGVWTKELEKSSQ